MFKRITFVLLLLAVAAGVGQAQTPRDWIAWLFDPSNGTITQIDQSGANVGTIYLPLGQAFNAYGDEITISPNGRFIAYTAFDNTVPNGIQNRQLFVYDRTIDTTRLAFDLSGAVAADAAGQAFRPVPVAFNEPMQSFAFGFQRDGAWQVVKADLITQSPVATLDSTNAGSVVQENGVPIVLMNGNDYVAFAMFNVETGVMGGTYRWSISSGEVYREAVYTSLWADTLPSTGEVVTPAWNSGTNGSDSIDVFSASMGRFRLHTHTTDIDRAFFIADGAQVLGTTYQAESGEDALLILNRDGSIAAEIVGSLSQILGTPGGFAGTFEINGGVAVARVDTLMDNPYLETIWSGAGNIKLVHVQGVGNAPTQFPPWTPEG